MIRSRLSALVLGLLALSASACSGESSGGESHDNIFTATGEPRKLKFTSYVFVEPNASVRDIDAAIRRMNQSGLGALRTANIAVNTRELSPGDRSAPQFYLQDPKRTRREPVQVIDPSNPSAPPKDMLRVRYTYEDDAIVPDYTDASKKLRSSVSVGVLAGNYQSQSQRILRECTENGPHDREFESSIWYIFNPSLRSCKDAMKAEQKTIDEERAALTDKRKQVTVNEVNRLYVPITVKLARADEGDGTQRPEYDRLYQGGVKPGRLVVAMVNGKMADWAAGEHKESIDDDGYEMYFEGLKEIFKQRKFKFVGTEPAEDLTKLAVDGQTVSVPGGFDTIYKWEADKSGFPAGFTSAAKKRALRVAAGKKLAKHWVKFEAPVKVKIGGAAEKDVIIELNTYLEAETNDAPHRLAFKASDVFVYNGHSYIGYGPLDPSRLAHGDLPQSYQLFFMNSCISYNYYAKDYIALKDNKTKDLDLVTNGLESWVNGSGPAMGRFVGRLVDGKQATYAELIDAAKFESSYWGQAYDWGDDALRVVDGELDNQYDATANPIVVTAR